MSNPYFPMSQPPSTVEGIKSLVASSFPGNWQPTSCNIADHNNAVGFTGMRKGFHYQGLTLTSGGFIPQADATLLFYHTEIINTLLKEIDRLEKAAAPSSRSQVDQILDQLGGKTF